MVQKVHYWRGGTNMKKLMSIVGIAAVLLTPVLDITYAFTTPITVELMNTNYVGNETVIPFSVSTTYQVSGTNVTLQPGIDYSIQIIDGYLFIYKGTTYNSTTYVIKGQTLELIPSSYAYSNYITLDKGKNGQRIYLGNMTFKIDGSYVRPYNTLELEDYLKGVVPSEMSDSWGSNGGEEALKAQAIAARTYITPYLPGQNSNIINDTTGFQVYDGYHPTYSNSNNAVDTTQGQTITYNGNPIDAVFSSSNGGYMESDGDAWGGSDSPYLIPKADPFDDIEPFNYSISETNLLANTNLLASIESAIGNQQVTAINSITPIQINEGQRPKYLTFNVTTASGANANGNVLTSTVRSEIGGRLIKSNYITNITYSNGTFTFSGTGYGHGVGMSQNGAYKMSQVGYDYKNILGFYYPNTQLKTGATSQSLIFSSNGTSKTNTATAQNVYIVDYTGPSLNVSFYAPAQGDVDIGIYDMNGNLVKQMTTRTWESSGTLYFPLTNPGLNGTYQVRLRYGTYLGNVYYYNQNILFSTDNPQFTSATAVVSGQNVTATYSTNGTGYILAEVVDSLGNRYAVIDPYVSKTAGTYSVSKNLTQLNGNYLIRYKIFNNIGKVTDEREVSVALQGNIPSYGNQIKTGSAYGQTNVYSDTTKQTIFTNVYGSEAVKVLQYVPSSNLYEIEYDGQTGYIDANSIAVAKQPSLSISMNGYNLVMDTNPVIQNNRTVVPARWVANGLGFDSVTWDGTKGEAVLTKGTTTIELPLGQSYAYVNGTKIALDTTIQAYNDRIFVPLRFVSEQIGAKVGYDGDHNMIWVQQ